MLTNNKYRYFLIPAVGAGILGLTFHQSVTDYLRQFSVQTKSGIDANIKAFLDVISACEGTNRPDGYNLLFGYGHFNGFADHPDILVKENGYNSTAAGRYQIIYSTFKRLQKKLGTTGFAPDVQDRMAIELIGERGAYDDVVKGDLASALQKCSREWASLPYAPYGQPTKSYTFCMNVFQNSGGKITG